MIKDVTREQMRRYASTFSPVGNRRQKFYDLVWSEVERLEEQGVLAPVEADGLRQELNLLAIDPAESDAETF